MNGPLGVPGQARKKSHLCKRDRKARQAVRRLFHEASQRLGLLRCLQRARSLTKEKSLVSVPPHFRPPHAAQTSADNKRPHSSKLEARLLT